MRPPPLSLERLSILPDGRVAYRIKNPRGHQTHCVMTPTLFLARLCALIPPPRHPLVRFHGVFAPHSSWRKDVVALAPACPPSPNGVARPWAVIELGSLASKPYRYTALIALASGLACSPRAEPKQPASAPSASSSSFASPKEPVASVVPSSSASAAGRPGVACAGAGATSCGEGLACFPESAGSSVCARPLHVAQLLSESDRYRGVLVGLSSVRVTQMRTCTEQACGAANPCCNHCSARAYIGDEPELLGLSRADGSPYAANGTNCKLDSEIGLGVGPYSMLGTLEVRAMGPAFRATSIVAEPSR